MNTLFDFQKQIPSLSLAGWNALAVEVRGENSGACAASMEETSSVLKSPRYLHKRRRLSRLLDKLTVHIHNNNNYPPGSPPWFMFDTPYPEPSKATAPEDDAPLDLSLKPDKQIPVKPKVEPKQPPSPSYRCNACGQTFSVHDRLAKHIASRHRGRTPESARAYECDVCHRRFARSDMLTRHARLHSGVKPYACKSCQQVFSRSDHLATHQRTHTGEKPYRCPACPYAACRRDMITRHMRTHSRRPQPA